MLLAVSMLVTTPLALTYRLVSPDSPIFFIGMGIGIFQLAAFYGPTFSTVQELAPSTARATVTAFYILCLNVIGLGIGNTGAGILVDRVKAAGGTDGYSQALVLFTAVSLLALPLFAYAGRRFAQDRDRLYAELGASGAA